MKRLIIFATLAAIATPLAARPRTSVTRFFLASDVARGSVAPANYDGGLQAQLYRDAIAAELNAQGFAPAGGNARYVYAMEFSRDIRPGASRKPSFSVGLGGSSGGYYGGGVGGGVGIGLGGGRREAAVTNLSVQLRERGGSTVWEGRAVTEDSPATGEREIAQRLAHALFRDFPGQNGRTITVK